MTFADILREAHSGVRWLVALMVIVLLVKNSIGWGTKSAYQPLDRRLMSIFSALFGIQFTLGLILFVVLIIQVGFFRYQAEHILTMVIAFFVAMRSTKWKNGEDHIPYRNNVLMFLLVGVLIYVGVLVLPAGWAM